MSDIYISFRTFARVVDAMNLILNDENLQLDEINEFNSKVRAILIDSENKVLVANYGGVFLFPGGSIDDGENIDESIIRELQEETGTDYETGDFTFLTQLDFFQKNYVKRDGMKVNRLIRTYYFIASYKPVKLRLQKLTEKEKKDDFKLAVVPLCELKKLVLKNKNSNPRNFYFQREMIEVIDLFTNVLKQGNFVKKKKSN